MLTKIVCPIKLETILESRFSVDLCLMKRRSRRRRKMPLRTKLLKRRQRRKKSKLLLWSRSLRIKLHGVKKMMDLLNKNKMETKNLTKSQRKRRKLLKLL